MKTRGLYIVPSMLIAIMAVGLLSISGVQTADAAPAPPTGSGQALEIGPPVLNLSANPGQVINTQISLRDISDSDLIVHGQVNDFTASGEDGTPKILLDETKPSPYSFQSWLSPLPTLTLKPKQLKALPITISVPKNASPGGYYGVIRFTANPPELDTTGVSLSASLGSLVLIRVNGTAKEKLSIPSFTTSDNSTIFEGLPIQFDARVKNEGNIFEEPAGVITITDMFGKTVATLPINQPPGNILPQTIRKFTQKLDKSVLGNKHLFGLYHAKLSVSYGTTKQTVTSPTFQFWVIPYKIILGIIVLIIIVVLAGRYLMKSYNRYIIAQSKKSRR